ncbi:MAG TPA: hypothetical protein IGS51_02930 [Thermoleptolyngbya sp. M55_K2018_002]|nr:hypothetical protein [Thermoleptolyngbya sp. M55_K2018_002]
MSIDPSQVPPPINGALGRLPKHPSDHPDVQVDTSVLNPALFPSLRSPVNTTLYSGSTPPAPPPVNTSILGSDVISSVATPHVSVLPAHTLSSVPTPTQSLLKDGVLPSIPPPKMPNLVGSQTLKKK